MRTWATSIQWGPQQRVRAYNNNNYNNITLSYKLMGGCDFVVHFQHHVQFSCTFSWITRILCKCSVQRGLKPITREIVRPRNRGILWGEASKLYFSSLTVSPNKNLRRVRNRILVTVNENSIETHSIFQRLV